jgi:hypothetical protein
MPLAAQGDPPVCPRTTPPAQDVQPTPKQPPLFFSRKLLSLGLPATEVATANA